MTGIYIIKNKINDKIYVGQSTNINVRIKSHLYGKKRLIDKTIRKYGWENFELSTSFVEEEDLDYTEQQYIILCNSMVPNGYNLDSGGNERKHLSEETKKKIGKANKGEKNSMYGLIGERHPRYGKKHTEETKRKMRKNHTDVSGNKNPMFGKTGSKHHMFGKTGEQAPFYGKKHTEETKKKISESLKDKIVSKETRHKQSIALNGEKNPMFGKKHTEETKKRMRETHRKRRQRKSNGF